MPHLQRQYNSYSNLLDPNRGQYYNLPELHRFCSQCNYIDDHTNLHVPPPVLHRPPVKTENYPNQWTTSYRAGEDRVTINKNGPSQQDLINLIEQSKNIDLWTASRPKGQALKKNGQVSCTIPDDENQKPLRKEWSSFKCCCCCGLSVLYLVLAFCVILLVLHLYYPENLHIVGVRSKSEKMDAIVTRNKEDIDAIMHFLESFCRMWMKRYGLLVKCEQLLQKKLYDLDQETSSL